jgi:prophage antirepressor-like protein
MELINSIDKTFKFENKEIRVLGNYNEPLFVAKDICNILELSNITESLRNIPEKWKCSEILNTLTRGKQTMIILKEPAVYQLIMRSTKPIAQKFQEVVCEEILPSIRKTGEYKFQALLKEKTEELEQKLIQIEEEKEVIIKKNEELSFKISSKVSNFKKGDSIYVGANLLEKDNFKVGITDNLNRRVGNFNTSTSADFEMLKTWNTRFSKEIEDAVKKNFCDYRIHVERKEFYKLEIYDDIVNYIEKLVEIFNSTDRFKESDNGFLNINDVQIDKKVCTRCLKYLNIYEFYLKDSNYNPDLPKNITEFNDKQEFYNKKYRSHCKTCHSKDEKEIRKKVKENPNFSKKECDECKILLSFDLYYKDDDNNLYSTCIDCYKNKHVLEKNVKQCNNCKELKSFDKFQQDSTKKDGFHTQCKDCRNQKAKEYRKNLDDEKVKCEFCNKISSNIHNLKIHQKTLNCLNHQGKKVEIKSNKSKCKKIEQIDKNTNNIIKEFESIEQAAKELKISRSTISRILRNIDKPTGDFTWKYSTL